MGPTVASASRNGHGEAAHVCFREDSEVIPTQGHMAAPLSLSVEEDRVPDEVRAAKVRRLSGGNGKDQDGETTEEVEGGDSEPISVEQALMLASQHKEHLLQILRQIAESFAKETERMNKQLQAHVNKVAEDIEASYTSKSQAIMKLHQHNQKSALSLDSASRVLKNNQGALEVIMRCCNSGGTQDEDSEA